MAINFPALPSDGDVYLGYYWDDTKGVWRSQQINSSSVVTSSTAPTNATDGDFWFNSTDGTLYVYFNDGITSQWVEVRSQYATSQVGLVPVVPSSVSVSGGTASVALDGSVSFTSCTGINVNGIFSSTFKNYLMVCESETTGSACDIYGQLVTSAGTALSSGYVGGRIGVSNNGATASNWQGASGVIILSRSNGANGFGFTANIYNPFVAKQKKITTNFLEISTVGMQGYINPSTTSYSSILFYANGTTMNTGVVKFYGYN